MEKLLKSEKYLCGVIFLILIILSGLQVIFRYMAFYSLDWIQEYTLISFVWFVYLSASVCAAENKHISVDMFINRLPKKLRFVSQVISNLIWLICCAVLFYTSMQVVALSFSNHAVTIVNHTPFWIVQASVPVGMALMMLNVLYVSKRLISDFGETSRKEG